MNDDSQTLSDASQPIDEVINVANSILCELKVNEKTYFSFPGGSQVKKNKSICELYCKLLIGESPYTPSTGFVVHHSISEQEYEASSSDCSTTIASQQNAAASFVSPQQFMAMKAEIEKLHRTVQTHSNIQKRMTNEQRGLRKKMLGLENENKSLRRQLEDRETEYPWIEQSMSEVLFYVLHIVH